MVGDQDIKQESEQESEQEKKKKKKKGGGGGGGSTNIPGDIEKISDQNKFKKKSVIAIIRGARYRTDKQLHEVQMLDFVRFASFSVALVPLVLQYYRLATRYLQH